MAKRSSRRTTGGLEAVIDGLHLEPEQDAAMKARWLDQVTWMDRRATSARLWFVVLRMITILGAVVIPVLVRSPAATSRLAASILGLVVAGTAAVEGFFHFGDRWQHYRLTAEALRSEGWRFIQLTEPYRPPPGRRSPHQLLYAGFAKNVEDILHHDVAVFLSRMAPPEAGAAAVVPPEEPPGGPEGREEGEPPDPPTGQGA